jgi:hypothetical protein
MLLAIVTAGFANEVEDVHQYATVTILAQIAVLATVLILWSYGKKSHGAPFAVEVTDS